MAVTSSGQIKISDIVAEFGGSAPHAMSEYYGKDTVPASGEISISDFYGTTDIPAFTSSGTFPSFYSVGQSMAVTNNTSGIVSNISTNVNSTSIGNWDYRIVSGQTVSSFTESYWFSSTADSRGTFITFKGDTTISTTFRPSNRKLWTVIYVDGNLTLSGTLSMSQRGANHSGTTKANMRIIDGTYSGVSNPQIPADGGAGKSNSPSNNATTGNAGTAGGTGAGGNGHNGDTGRTGTGGGGGSGGTSYSGGSGGGGVDGCTSSINAVANGGRGGHGCGERAGAGAGNPGGSPGPLGGSGGGSGTGGVLIVICTGTISGGGSMVAAGTSGGCWSGSSRAGGGSGGGSVNVLCNTNSFTGSISANGGSGCSGSGGAGTARILTGV